ncbi:MAG: hypothetical protein ACYC6M_13370, partial [Terriglobales bacterium]
MSQRDLLTDPLWTPDTLGRPVPDSVHAVSVSMPRWQDVVDYEEKRPAALQRLASGYPRFLIHPLVEQLARRLSDGAPCLPFPSPRVAERGAAFVRQAAGVSARIVNGSGVFGVVTTEQGYAALRAYWQHTGLIVSSRQAEDCLASRPTPGDAAEARQSLRQQLADLYHCEAADVFLAPTGMASVYAALKAVIAWRPGLPTAQLGFPYVDT